MRERGGLLTSFPASIIIVTLPLAPHSERRVTQHNARRILLNTRTHAPSLSSIICSLIHSAAACGFEARTKRCKDQMDESLSLKNQVLTKAWGLYCSLFVSQREKKTPNLHLILFKGNLYTYNFNLSHLHLTPRKTWVTVQSLHVFPMSVWAFGFHT